jgi:hypothetical protein
MIFKLIAALFVVTNGIPAENPTHVMNFNQSAFETEESCTEFLGTDDGRASVFAISMAARSQGVAVKFACVEAKDNSI